MSSKFIWQCRGKDKTHENDGFPSQQEASDSPDTVFDGFFLCMWLSIHPITLGTMPKTELIDYSSIT